MPRRKKRRKRRHFRVPKELEGGRDLLFSTNGREEDDRTRVLIGRKKWISIILQGGGRKHRRSLAVTINISKFLFASLTPLKPYLAKTALLG